MAQCLETFEKGEMYMYDRDFSASCGLQDGNTCMSVYTVLLEGCKPAHRTQHRMLLTTCNAQLLYKGLFYQ